MIYKAKVGYETLFSTHPIWTQEYRGPDGFNYYDIHIIDEDFEQIQYLYLQPYKLWLKFSPRGTHEVECPEFIRITSPQRDELSDIHDRCYRKIFPLVRGKKKEVANESV